MSKRIGAAKPKPMKGQKQIQALLPYLQKAQAAKDAAAAATKAAKILWEAEGGRVLAMALEFELLEDADAVVTVTDGTATLRIGAALRMRKLSEDSEAIFKILEDLEEGLAFELMGFGIGALEKQLTFGEFASLITCSRGDFASRTVKVSS